MENGSKAIAVRGAARWEAARQSRSETGRGHFRHGAGSRQDRDASACLCRAPAGRWGRSMRELEYRLLETVRSDFAFLRSLGIEPCVIDRPLLLPYPGRPPVRLTDADARWLKACGVAWEPEPAIQLPLDFCQRHSLQQQDV